MDKPKFSVIIPAYNGNEHLGEAIQSVLDQTYPNFEIIVVDDASPQDMSQTVNSFTDHRVRYVRHAKNKGAVAARKTGVQESNGDILAFLDQDDLFHKQKLAAHLEHFENNPETGMTYNNRFSIQGTEKILSGIHKPPVNLSLADLVSGYPVSPSDVVLKREWALRDEIWDDSFAGQTEHVIFNGQEIVFGGRLALAGCQFGCVRRALNYRRFHPSRILKYLPERCQAELSCQEIIFSDPRCPEEIRALQNRASSNIYLMFAYAAYLQEEFELGRHFLKQTMSLYPDFFKDGESCQFLNTWMLWVSAGTAEYAHSHEEVLQSIFKNLPDELAFLQKKYDATITQSYLLKGFRTLVWRGMGEAESYLKTAFDQGAIVDETALSMLVDDLLDYGDEVDQAAPQELIDQLSRFLTKLNRKSEAKNLLGYYAINRAFRDYQAGVFENVPGEAVKAFKSDTSYLLNKGLVSIFFRSLYHSIKA